MHGRKNGISQLVRRGLLFAAPLQGRASDGPTDHRRFQLRIFGLMAPQSFQQKFTENGLHPGFDYGLKLPLVFLTAGGNFRQEISGGEDQLPQACFARPLASRHAGVNQRAESFANHRLQQRELVGEVIVKSGSVKGGALGDVLHRNEIKGLFREQVLEGLKKHLPRATNARVYFGRIKSHTQK